MTGEVQNFRKRCFEEPERCPNPKCRKTSHRATSKYLQPGARMYAGGLNIEMQDGCVETVSDVEDREKLEGEIRQHGRPVRQVPEREV